MAVACDSEHGLARHHIALRIDLVDGAADHHAHDLVLAGVPDQSAAHHLAVAEDGEPVGDAVDLVEFVRDEQHRLAGFAQQVDEHEQVLDLLVRQCRRRLVHDDDLGVDRHGAGDGHQMLVGDREFLEPRLGMDVPCADLVEQLAGAVLHGAPVDGSRPGLRRMAEKDVLRHAQLVKQHGFLMNGGDAEPEGLVWR